MEDKHIEKIKSRGYWRVNYQPLIVDKKLRLSECKQIVRKNDVALRGWNFPHFPEKIGKSSGVEPCDGYYQGWTDWESYVEFWRMYRTKQFLCYRALHEDWYEGREILNRGEKIEPFTVINVIGTIIYGTTEIIEFLRRLAEEGIYDSGVIIKITLYNMKNRELWINDPRRVPMLSIRKTNADRIHIEKELSKNQILEDFKEIILDVIKEIFEYFDWDSPPIESIENDRDKLLGGII